MKKYITEGPVVPGHTSGVVNFSAAAGNSDWVSLENYDSARFYIVAADGTASQDVTFTVEQATAAAGTGRKTVAGRKWYSRVSGTSLAGTPNAESEGDSYVLQGNRIGIIVVEVTADELDVAGGFKYVSIRNTDPGAAAKNGVVLCQLAGARYVNEVLALPDPTS